MSVAHLTKGDAVPVIQDWLSKTYQEQEGETLSKRDVYSDYLDFCRASAIPSTNPSTFGKILKLVFPNLTSRRIGPRGDSFPHYNSFTRIIKKPETGSPKSVPQRRVIKRKRRKTDNPDQSDKISLEEDGANDKKPARKKNRTGGQKKDKGKLGSGTQMKGDKKEMKETKPNRTKRKDKAFSIFEDDQDKQGESDETRETFTLDSEGNNVFKQQQKEHQEEEEGNEEDEEEGGDEEIVDNEEGVVLLDEVHIERVPRSSPVLGLSGLVYNGIVSPQYFTHFDPLSPPSTDIDNHYFPNDFPLLQPPNNNSHNIRTNYNNYNNNHNNNNSNQSAMLSMQQLLGSDMGDDDGNSNALVRYLEDGDSENVLHKLFSDSLMWDTHLQFVTIVDTYRTNYARYIFATNPTNPAALDMANIKYLVCTSEGSAERSVLSLNVYFLLSVGSLYVGDFDRAKEFYNLTREHLGYVFDVTDYSLALVLIPLSFLARYWADNEEDGARISNYYLTLGKSICETLGCMDNPLYLRFTQSLAWFDHSNLEEDVKRQEGLPYFPTLTSDSMRVVLSQADHYLLEEASLTEQCTYLSCTGVIGSVLKGIMAYKMHRVMRDKWESYILIGDEEETNENEKGKEKEKEKEKENENEKEKDEQPRTQRPSKEGEVIFGNGLTLMKLMDALGNTEKALRARMVSDKPLPRHILLFLKEFLWAEEAIIFHYLNEVALAMKVIKYFILSLKGFKNVLHCATILEVPMGMVMEVLAKNNEMDHFNDILKMLEPVSVYSPSVRRMVQRFMRMDADNFW